MVGTDAGARYRYPPRDAPVRYVLRVSLLDIEPEIWWSFQVNSDTEYLHETIQTVMGWQDYHLHKSVLVTTPGATTR
ncbi:MAG: hypothetical protein WAW17_11000 [Rhodococcus sp. (in: high G+C Gram-positive bacteria)]|uniref:IS1096 element passenger TnpR family protein n=1 Tax=Rhodococcus sp. TaxID=1831 RepID=UPI003BB0F679